MGGPEPADCLRALRFPMPGLLSARDDPRGAAPAAADWLTGDEDMTEHDTLTLQLLEFLRYGTLIEDVEELLTPMPELAREAWKYPERATALLVALDDDVLLQLWDEAGDELRATVGESLADSLMWQAAGLHERGARAQAVAAGLPTDTDRLERLPGLPTDPGRLRELAAVWETAGEFLPAEAARVKAQTSI